MADDSVSRSPGAPDMSQDMSKSQSILGGGDLLTTADDAAEFVASVMLSQHIERVETPKQSRKRNASSDIDTTVKKSKTTGTSARSLFDKGPKPAPRKSTSAEVVEIDSDADTQIEESQSQSVELLINKLSSDMHMLFSSLSERMDKLESSLEQRISTKVSQILDKRVNSEMNRLRKDVDGRLATLKQDVVSEVSSDIDDIKEKLESVSSRIDGTNNTPAADDITLNVVIRQLPETGSENVTSKVNALIKDGLKVTDVKCVSADRKRSHDENRPGVIIAKFRSHEDKRKVMSKKALLGKHRVYGTVFLDHDLSRAERVMASNFRSIISAVRNSGLRVVGNRVVSARGNGNAVNGRGSDVTNERYTRRDSHRGGSTASPERPRENNSQYRSNRNDNRRQEREGSDQHTTYIGRGANRGRGGYRGNNRGRY